MKPEESDASVRVTKHAKQRSRERAGLSKSSLQRMLPKIVVRGRRASEFAGAFQRYLISLQYLHSDGNQKDVIVYALHIYIIIDQRVITVMKVPRKYIKVVTSKVGNYTEEQVSFEKIRKRSRCST